MTITVKGHKVEFAAKVNPEFDDDREIVLRRGEYASKRTLGLRAEKACNELPEDMRAALAKPDTVITVTFS